MPIRWRIWTAAWAAFAQHPLLGVGLGQGVVGVAFTTPSGEEQWLTDAHNTWLAVAGQTGIVGVLSLVALVVFLLCGGLVLNGDVRVSMLRTACIVAFIDAFMYQGLTGSFENARHLWLLMGLLACFSRPAWDRPLRRECSDS
jgi:O-antigen ligase